MIIVMQSFFGYSFVDDDMDGVENSLDRCPNSKITDIVDKYGCATEKLDFKDSALMELSAGILKLKNSNLKYQTAFISFDYQKNNFGIYFRSGRFDISDTSEDFTLMLYHTIEQENSTLNLNLGAYFPDTSSSSADIFAGGEYRYYFDYFDVMLGYNHTFANSLDDSDALYFGIGTNITNKLYLSSSLEFQTSNLDDDFYNFSIFADYDINTFWHISSTIIKGLNSASYDSFSFLVGYRF